MTSLGDGRNGETISFGYDHLDRLISASAPLNESYGYDNIGRMTTRNTSGYDYTGTPHIHAPRYVAGNYYDYDPNGNLITAEGRTYEYDAENRLIRVRENGTEIRSFAYDGDGALRTVVQSGQTIHYVTPDYRYNLTSGEPTVYYRFNGKAVAWRNNSALRYVLSDHLSSTHGEAGENQAEMGQRRYLPFGSDRAVTGANDPANEERFTSQRRIDAGNGNARRELYNYGARWYLPGVGIFTQPDTVVPDYKNPQALNRYSYANNNPVKFTDPTGHKAYTDEIYGSWSDGSDAGGGSIELDYTPPGSDAGYSTAIMAAQTIPDVLPDGVFSPNPADSGLSLASSSGAATFLSMDGPAVVVNNAPGIIGDAVKLVGGGQDNTITLNPLLIVSSYDISIQPDVLAHETGHLEQGLLIGPMYLPTYVGLAAATALAFQTLNGETVHTYHPMEIAANIRANLPWDYPYSR